MFSFYIKKLYQSNFSVQRYIDSVNLSSLGNVMVSKSKYVKGVTVIHTVIYQIFVGGGKVRTHKKQEKKVGRKHDKSKRNR